MTIPHEDALAFFPTARTVGNVTLHPLTLAGAVRLAEAGVDLGRNVPREKVFVAAYILSSARAPFDAFCQRARVGLTALSEAVESTLNDAYETFIKPAQEKGATVSLTPHGLGWPLEYAEYLCGEYGWSFEEALNTPVVTVFALYAAYRQRNNGKFAGFDYIEKAFAKNLKAKKHHG